MFQNGSLKILPDTDVVEIVEPKQMGGKIKRMFTYWSNSTRIPLFMKEELELADVSQGMIGDCWFLAAVVAVVNFPGGSKIIRDTMIDCGDGHVVVRLFDGCEPPNAHYIKVKKSRASFMGHKKAAVTGISSTGFWPVALEKAACCFVKSTGRKTIDTNNPSFSNIEGGHSTQAFRMLFGLEVAQINVPTNLETHRSGFDRETGKFQITEKAGYSGSGVYTPEQKTLFNDITNKLRAHAPVAFGTKENIGRTNSSGHSAGESKVMGMVAKHAYAVIDTLEENILARRKWIKVANPWGESSWTIYGRSYKETYNRNNPGKMPVLEPKEEKAGAFWLEFNDFCTMLEDVYVCSSILPQN